MKCEKECFWTKGCKMTRNACHFFQEVDMRNPSLNSNKQNKETIKDDRDCKVCGKKLTEHSSFSDSHAYIPKKTKVENG